MMLTARCTSLKNAEYHPRYYHPQVKQLEWHDTESYHSNSALFNTSITTYQPCRITYERKKCLMDVPEWKAVDYDDVTYFAFPCWSAVASFSGIFAGELARSRTNCQYVLAKRKMKTTLMRRNKKYLSECLRSKSSAKWKEPTFALESIQLSFVLCTPEYRSKLVMPIMSYIERLVGQRTFKDKW